MVKKYKMKCRKCKQKEVKYGAYCKKCFVERGSMREKSKKLIKQKQQ